MPFAPTYPGAPLGPGRLSYARKHVCQGCGLRGSKLRLGLWWCTACLPLGLMRMSPYPETLNQALRLDGVQQTTTVGRKVGP